MTVSLQGPDGSAPEGSLAPPLSSTLQRTFPVLASFLLSVVVWTGLAFAEDHAMSARLQEARGDTRGAILDRAGRPLVVAPSTRGAERRTWTVPDITGTAGYLDPSGIWRGLEGQYNRVLDAVAARDDWRSFFLRLRGTPVRGGSLQLTLDARVQRAASAALGRAPGAVVAIDPRTGGVLALVSHPSCNATELSNRATYQSCLKAGKLRDKATNLAVPPGSAFKIVTLTAALDTGRFHLRSVFSGADVWGPSPYFDNTLYPSNVTRTDLSQLTLAQALAFSDNFTFAHIGLTLGGPALLRYAHRYFIGRHIPFAFPVAVSRIADGSADPTPGQVARSSFGAEDDRVTPMQMALIAATVANHGTMMAPHVVMSAHDAGGKLLYHYRSHALSRVMSPAAAREVTQGMEFVVQHGSGYRAQIAGTPVAGKTGTAASGHDKPNAWFICFAPANHPVIAVAVLHQVYGEGFEYAAPIARKVLVAGLRASGMAAR